MILSPIVTASVRLLGLGTPLLCALSACVRAAPETQTPTALAAPEARIAQTKSAGDYLGTAELQKHHALQVPSPQREELMLGAVETLVTGRYFDQAQTTLDQLDVSELGDALLLRKQIIRAEIELGRSRPAAAIEALNPVDHLQVSSSQRTQALSIRAVAYAMLRERVSTSSAGAMMANIAVLLPLSGTHQAAGEAVLAGILSSYYSWSAARPQLQVIDVGSASGTITDHYRRAVAAGAQFAIGPLQKESVAELLAANVMSIPTIALNTGPRPVTAADFFQFSLDPEDEARQSAQQAFSSGYRRVVCLYPPTPWGERVVGAFRETWLALGGVVLDSRSYGMTSTDHNNLTISLLAIDRSRARAVAVKGAVAAELEFQPRRRKDVDVVFIAALPEQARSVVPQLRFNFGEGLPIYGTPHLFSGIVDQVRDRDLDDVTFCDAPWVLRDAGTATGSDGAQTSWLPRLFGLGADALALVPQLDNLRRNPLARLPGKTGALAISPDGVVTRRLDCAVFRNGRPVNLGKVSEGHNAIN